MKLMIASDLHREFWRYDPFWDNLDGLKDTVLVLAGDVFPLNHYKMKAVEEELGKLCDAFRAVVYVPGNHEHYQSSIYTVLNIAAGLNDDFHDRGLHVLMNSIVIIDGQRFIGGTGWVPKVPKGTPEISDSWCIKGFAKGWYAEEHKNFKRVLTDELRADDVVVSHHAPSEKSIAPQWIGNDCNPWFIAPDLEPLIVDRQPKLWVHGHVHSSFDYRIGNTRLVCNPQGYEREGQTQHFNPRLIIDV